MLDFYFNVYIALLIVISLIYIISYYINDHRKALINPNVSADANTHSYAYTYILIGLLRCPI